MAVYNGAAHLPAALDSLQAQTFTDYECLIVDDGSTDATPGILADYARRDARFRIVNMERGNQGLAVALNTGLDMARGVYIARMDADDISLPERFARQVAALESRPDIGILGAAVQLLGGPSAGYIQRYPADPDSARCLLLLRPVLAHPVVMLRRAVLEAHHLRYNPALRRAQDYELWLRAADVTGIASLPEVLLHYRVGEAQSTAQHRAEQLAATLHSQQAHLKRLGIDPTPDELRVQQALFTGERHGIALAHIERWLARLEAANRARCLYPPALFGRLLAEELYRLCRIEGRLSAAALYATSPLRRYLPWHKAAKLIVRNSLKH
jgi:hypothetical protein